MISRTSVSGGNGETFLGDLGATISNHVGRSTDLDEKSFRASVVDYKLVDDVGPQFAASFLQVARRWRQVA